MLKLLAKLMGMKGLENRDSAEVRSVFLLLWMYAFLVADTWLINPIAKPIMDEFHRNEAQVGLISSIFVLLGACIAIPWGYFADRYQRKTLVAFTIILGEIPCFMTGFVKTYDQLFWVRALTGLGIGGILPLTYSMISDLVSERERSTASAWMGLAEGIGTALGVVLAGNFGKLGFSLLGVTGWRLPFMLVAIPNCILVPIFLLTCREPARGSGEDAIKKEIDRGLEYTRRIKLEDYKTIFRNRTNLLAFLQGIPGTVGWGVLPAWLITFYHVKKGVPIAMATNIMMLVGVGMIAGGVIGGITGDKIQKRDKKYMPLFCGITTLIGIMFFYLMIHYPLSATPSVKEMTAPLIIGVTAGLFITMTSSVIRAMVLNVNPPENRGAMMSLFSVTDAIGKGTGPYLGGLLIVALGYVKTMDLAIFFWVPCALIFLFLLTPQYPKDVNALDKLMAERAKEMVKD